MVVKNYDAFLSYKHDKILPFAQMLARSLRTYATGVFSRPRNIFRDEDHLAPDSSLPELIQRALEKSRFLVLLASREAARSPWVERELRIWCGDLGRVNRLLILLLDGSIEVDSSRASINWETTDALPQFLQEYLADVPLFIDVTELRSESDLNERNPVFKAAVAKIVARLLGVDVHELIGYEIAQHRRRVRIRNAAVAALAVLTVVSVLFGIYANKQRNEQQKATYAAIANALSAQVRPDLSHGLDEHNALLAKQAYLFARRSGKSLPDSINRALQIAVSPEYFTVSRPVGTGFVTHLATGANGRVLAAAGDFSTVYVWDDRLPGTPKTLTMEANAKVSSLAIDSRGGRLAVAVRDDGSVRLWNLNDIGSTRPAVILTGGRGITNESLRFDTEGNRLAAVGNDDRVRIWKISDLNAQPVVIRHSDNVVADRVVAAKFVGDHLFTATVAGDIQAWSRDGENIKPMHWLYESSSGAIDISNTGHWVAMSPFGGKEVRMYDLRNPSAAPVILKSEGEITVLAFSPDDDRIAAGTSSGDIVIWEIGANDRVTRIPSGHGTGVTAIAFVDGPGIASAGQQDGQIRLRYLKGSTSTVLKDVSLPRFGTTDDRILVVDSSSSRPAVRTPSGAWMPGGPKGLPESPETHWYTGRTGFVSINFTEKTGALWSSMTPASPVRQFRFPGYDGERGVSVTTSNDGQLLAWVDPDDTSVWVIDFSSPNAVPFSLRDGPIRKTIRSFIAPDGTPTKVLTLGTRDWEPPLAISPDGKRIAVGAGDGSVRVWNVRDSRAEPLVFTPSEGWPMSIAFSGDGALLGVGSTNHTVVIWSLAERRNVTTLAGHGGRVDAVAFAPQGSLLASGGTDRIVRLWDLGTKNPLPVQLEESDSVDALEFSPSGQKLIVSSGGSAHVWTVTADVLADKICHVVSRNLSLEEWRSSVGQEFEYERTCENLPVHPSLLETAKTLATGGAQDQSNALVSRATKIDPEHTAEWRAAVEHAVANALVAKGEEIARTGDAAAGAALIKKGLSRGATLTTNPDEHARQLAAAGLLMQGQELKRAKDADRALALFNHSIQMAPTADAYASRGFVLAQRGETDKAIADYDRALSLDPTRWDVHGERAQELAIKEDWSAALAGYTKALELVRADERQNRSILASRTGVLDESQWVLLKSENAEQTFLQGRAYAALQMGDATGAKADYNFIISDNPKDVPALLGRATAYRMDGQCDKAIQDLTTVVENERNWYALLLRGKCLGDLGSYSKGLRDLEDAAVLKPDDQEVQHLIRSYRTQRVPADRNP